MTTTTTSAARSPAQQWSEGWARGFSQIFFQTNTFSALIILAAFAVADWRMALLALVGALFGAVGGFLCRFPLSSLHLGMQSFCGALVGAAVFTALGAGTWQPWALTAVGGLATGPVTWVINWLFTRTGLSRFELPYTTAPFCLVATVAVVSTRSLDLPAAASPKFDQVWLSFGSSILTNVSQVVLIDNLWSGALILVALFVAGWRVGAAAVLGSVLGTLVNLGMGEDISRVGNGLIGYSGVLTAIALTSVFLKSSRASWLYALPWIVVTAVVTVMMERAGLMTYTWPYILTTWVALIVAHFLGGLKRT